MQFDAWYFLLMLPLLIPLWLAIHKEKIGDLASMLFPDVAHLEKYRPSVRVRAYKVLKYIPVVMLALMIIGLSRPQFVQTSVDIISHGVDIILAVDVSGSMAAEDLKPENRLTAAKAVLKQFIRARQYDRIGLVIFAGKSYTQVPLTLDHNILEQFIDKLHIGMIDDGTAIGMAIATSLNRLRDSDAKSRILVLLTDGENNMGAIDPLSAAHLASPLEIKIYTVGVGKEGGAPIPYIHPQYGKQYHRNFDGTPVLTRLDEETLQQVAAISEGRYFRADNTDTLKNIYEKIDKLEKTEIKTKQYHHYTELGVYFIYGALILLIIEMLLSLTWLKKIP